MYRENYIDSLRQELLGMVADHLTPVALRYGYSDVPLEANIKWRPQVLLLGNYSSGKSTLINELLGAEIQRTGQAPTDDSFTVITASDDADMGGPVRVVEEREGKVLLNDPQYPYEVLRKHGQRFAAHFRLKKVNSPFLKHLALIDTPGMVDSIAERDRGYDYQEVIGDLAQIADLVLVLFDPHKAGTVREAHASLRDTLPSKTFEDRLLFVLNRIDECENLSDLLRVYGTLCWNLSQMTGRKDIPPIWLTYSPHVAKNGGHEPQGFLRYLDNQREALKEAILEAPKHRLDHLASYVEVHGERLAHFLEALLAYKRDELRFRIKYVLGGLFASFWIGVGAVLLLMATEPFGPLESRVLGGAGTAVMAASFLLWMTVLKAPFVSGFHRNRLGELDDLTPLDTQLRKDTWASVRDLVYGYLKKTDGRFKARDVRLEHAAVRRVCEKGSREIRQALNELATIRHDGPEGRAPLGAV